MGSQATLTMNRTDAKDIGIRQVFVSVDPQRGGAVVRGASLMQQSAAPSGPASLSFGVLAEDGRFEPERLFLPFWQNR